ncbi:hypothetical protein VM1G_06269 [Cytospora mali]|uniref:Uncharacterized protein n=1 Tax=Cytospora mali TaxID=578113 RepID=A0A194W3G1_CYTMA|nr:hypothetical protein VM1G_06269 [Valsa mali]
MDKMSWLGVNARNLSRCGSRRTNMGVAPVRTAAPICHGIRQASTTPPETGQTIKKKAKEAATSAKKTSISSSAHEETSGDGLAPPSNTQGARKSKAAAPAKASAASTIDAPEPAAPSASATRAAAAASTTRFTLPLAQSSAPRTAAVQTGTSTPMRDSTKPKVDPSSPEYKEAARKWVGTIIALPILVVTSYFLFNRLILGNNPSLEDYRSKPRPSQTAESAKTGDA